MTDLLAARSQMGMSLAFHIIFSVIGIGMPLLMVIAEGLYLKTKDKAYLTLAKRWSKGTAIMFGVGAVSGTVLSFELGLLWPEFMAYAGAVIGMPFSLEGFAFFLEAIFLGIYLYGWERVSPKLHLAAGVGVMVSGALSGIFVTTVNAWMNTPAGFTLVDGVITDIDPFAAMMNPAAPTQVSHMTMAAFQAVGFVVAGIHAYLLLKTPGSAFHKKALAIALAVGGVSALIQPIIGDLSAKHVAKDQPVKFAAMEGHWETEACASFTLFGIPNEETRTTDYAIKVPCVLSILAFADPKAEVMGLNDVPESEWPPLAPPHIAFQIMVAAGMIMAGLGLIGAFLAYRKREVPTHPLFLKALVLAAPLGFIAVEAGWVVTEVGRQPYVVYGLLRTADAVTPMPGLMVPFLTFSALYFVLGIVVVILLKRQVFYGEDAPLEGEEDANAAL